MSQISEVTGLPELPEGMWWEVRKHVRRIYDSLPLGYHEDEDGYEICVVTKEDVPGTITPGKRWWNSPVIVPPSTKSKVLYRKQITDPKLYAEWVKACREGNWGSERLVGKSHIEPADVLKTAQDLIDIMAAEEAAKARKAKSDALIGAYPPKKLEAAK